MTEETLAPDPEPEPDSDTSEAPAETGDAPAADEPRDADVGEG